jgi:uncharacterized membrane protein
LVALLPYPAGILGRGFGLGLALACLLVPLVIIVLLLAALWELAVRQRLVIPELPRATVAGFRAITLAIAAALGIALILALASWALDSVALFYAGLTCGVLVLIAPIVVRRRWPTPDQHTYVPPDSAARAQHEQHQVVAVRSLLERIRNGSDSSRLCVFTDGVFAIAVTVLALQLKPPDQAGPLTNDAILSNLSTVPWGTYLTTFAFIGIYWITHVHTFEVVKGTDAILIWLNMVFLLVVAFLPLPTELVNRIEGSTTAWVFYFAMLFLVCAALLAMRVYSAYTTTLTVHRELPDRARYAIARTLWAACAFLAGMVLVVISDDPDYGNVVLVLILLRGPVLRRFYPDAHTLMWHPESAPG